jgi:hypothetical protein
MLKQFFKRVAVMVTLVAFATSAMPAASYAGMIDTATAVEATTREADLAAVNTLLARADVQQKLVQFGVSPAEAAERANAMTSAELRTLAERIDQMPAGGDGGLAVIGIVFVVLLILEMVGVIDIFKKFP